MTPQFPELVALRTSEVKCVRSASPEAVVAARIAERVGAFLGAGRFAALATVGRATVGRATGGRVGALLTVGALVAPDCANAPAGTMAGRSPDCVHARGVTGGHPLDIFLPHGGRL